MPSGDERVKLALKRFLSQNRMSENFMEYLDDIIIDGLSRIFPVSGLFTFPVTFSFPGAGLFSLLPDPIEGIDDQGRVLVLEGSARLSNISFEDDGSSHYWAGMKYIQIPSGVYNNPRTGTPEYDKLKDEVGELANPTDVTDPGGGVITFNVNSIFESGVDHSGRVVRVWLVNPMSDDPVIAFEDCTVAYSAPDNTITTVGLLGQASASLLEADYQVAALGVTVRKSATNPFGSEYTLLGDIDSSAGPTADIGGQIDLSGGGGHSMQHAYDGVGSGAGRNATIDFQAVKFQQANTTVREKDIVQAALRLEKSTDKSALTLGSVAAKDIEVGLDVKGRLRANGLVMTRVNLYDLSGNDYLRSEESDIQVTVNGDILTFNRAGVDLQMSGEQGRLLQGIDMCEISGSIAGNDGVYFVNAIATGSLTLFDLDYTAAALLQEVGNAALRASFYRPIFQSGGYQEQNRIVSVDDWMRDGAQTNLPLRVLIAPNADPAHTAQVWEIYGGDALYLDNDLKLRRNGANSLLISNGVKSAKHEYPTAKSFYRVINAYRAEPDGGNWTRSAVGLNIRNYYQSAGAGGALYFHFSLPIGAVLEDVTCLFSDSSTPMFIYLKRYADDFGGTPAVPNPVDLISPPPQSAGSAGLSRMILTPDATETVVNGYNYAVIFLSAVAGQFVYSILIRYSELEITLG